MKILERKEVEGGNQTLQASEGWMGCGFPEGTGMLLKHLICQMMSGGIEAEIGARDRPLRGRSSDLVLGLQNFSHAPLSKRF